MTGFHSKHQRPAKRHGTVITERLIEHIEQYDKKRVPEDIVYVIGERVASPQGIVNQVAEGSNRSKILQSPFGTAPPGNHRHLSIFSHFLRRGNEVKHIHFSLVIFNKLEHMLLGIIIKHETGIKGVGIKNKNCQDENCNVD